jgi:deoxyribodipyrimidine photolyase
VAQWLAATFGLVTADARTADNSALRLACEEGHLGVAQWLATTFGLTAEDARTGDNDALRCACEHGHLEVAQWLVKTFSLTREEVRVSLMQSGITEARLEQRLEELYVKGEES